MSKLLKLIKSLKGQGFATKAQKDEVRAMFKELEKEDQEAVADDVAEVEALSDSDPKEGEEVEKMVRKSFEKVAGDVETKLGAKLELAIKSMKEDIEAYVKSQKEAMAQKAGAFSDEVQVKRARLNSYLKKFAGAILSGDDTMAKEMSTDKTGSPFAGYVVDSELSAEIRHLVTEYGVARREFFTTPLSKNVYEANALATDVTVGWISEAGVIASTQVVLNQEDLKLKKLGAIVSLTRELIEDGEIDLFGFIATRVAEGFAKAEDRAFFAGEGAGDTANGEYEGLLFNTDIPSVSLTGALSTLSVEKIYETKDALPQGAQANAKWYGNRTVKSAIRLLKDGDGRYIYLDPINNEGLATLAGKPFVEVEAMPETSDLEAGDGFLVYGDLKKTAILGYRSGIVADRFNAGVIRNVANNADINLITTDREAVRWISRVGYITILPTASVVLKLAESES